MQDICKSLIEIIQNQQLTSLFQPIVSLKNKEICAYEALIRGPSDSALHSPISLFKTADRFQLTSALEQACREVSIQQFASLELNHKLFLNISPSVLLDPSFKNGETLNLLKQWNIDPSRVVIEITEYQPTDNYSLMKAAISHYRGMGFEIALDDLGAGYSGLRLWTELLPNYVKIDQHFIQNVDKDEIKKNFIRSIQTMAKATQRHVIAEGVETKEEYRTVAELAIDFAQGYYFARPSAEPAREISWRLFRDDKNEFDLLKTQGVTQIIELIQEVAPVSPQTSNSDILKFFQKNNNLRIIPLAEDGLATGLVYRDQFLSKLFASRYGIDLYGRLPVQSFIENHTRSFETHETIENVSQTLTKDMNPELAFIITDNGIYRGIGTVMDLLQLITQQQLQNARHANPLTQLPGIIPINLLIDRLLSEHKRFTIAYFDLDNFKPYNDHYGYDKGDHAIKLMAEMMTDSVSDGSGYIGHIGGDDFIAVYTDQNWESRCKQILSRFEESLSCLYSEKDLKAGGIETLDRRGQPCFFPLLSISIGLVSPDVTSQCKSHIDIADLASGAKHQAKKIDGNSYFINRRLPLMPPAEKVIA